ncbi:MAG: hypothetical protein ACE5FL_07500 [Myxococcota bacterium]
MRPDSGPRRAVAVCAFFGLVAVLAACATPIPDRERTPIPGTRVLLVIPDGFATAEFFPGLVSDDDATSVIVTEIAKPVDEVRATLGKREFALRGMTVLGSEEVEVDGFDALVVHASEPANDAGDLLRWVAVFGDDDASVMIAASSTRAGDDRLDALLKDVLATAVWNADERPDPYLGLGFRVAETELLKISERLPTMISFTVGGKRGTLTPDDPFFIAGSAVSPNRVTDIEAFARRRLEELPDVHVTELLSSRRVEIDGLRGHEYLAAANDANSGESLRIHQLLVIASDRYFLLQGLVGAEHAGKFLPHFRRISYSFERSP